MPETRRAYPSDANDPLRTSPHTAARVSGGYPVSCALQVGNSARLPGGHSQTLRPLGVEVGPKRLELARELFPGATTVALLVNPANPLAATVSKDLQALADTLGVRLHVLHASTETDFEAAFATAAQLQVALVIGSAIRCSAATPRSLAHSPSATGFQQSIFGASIMPGPMTRWSGASSSHPACG